VHLAGLSNDPTAEYNPEANWEMNAVATERLATLCRRAKIRRFTFGSSASIYDGLGDGTFDESTKVAPRGAYSRSKFAAEQALLRLADSDFSPVILRQGTVYGYSARMRLDLVVNTFIKDAIVRGKLFLHGGGWMWRPLVDVQDVAEAHLRFLQAPVGRVGGEIFNVVHQNFQIRQLAMLVSGSLAMRGRQVVLEDAPLPSLTRDYRCANRKLHDALGWTPPTGVLEAIEGILQHFADRSAMELGHPRYYNIEWMTLLEQAWESRGAFLTVWGSETAPALAGDRVTLPKV